MIDEFIGRLGTELRLTAEEIADIFWLTHIRQQLGETLSAESPDSLRSLHPDRGYEDMPPSPEGQEESSGSDETGEADAQEAAQPPDTVDVTSPQPRDHRADAGSNGEDSKRHRVKLPDAPSLRDPLSLMRALRPLIHPVDTRDRFLLDERATVQKIAEEQIWMPVTKPDQEPWLDLALVVDESNSMLIWRSTVLEIQRLLRYHGAFRDVRTWGLVWDETKREMAIRPRFGVVANHLSMRRPHELLDPNGRRLVVVVTDCVSQYWQTGRVTTALETWAQAGPMAILHMLPERLWPRTALRQASAVELLGSERGVANQKLRVLRQTIQGTVEESRQEIKIPVFSLEPELMALWSRMVMGWGGGSAVGYLWEVPQRHDAQPLTTAVAAAPVEPKQRLQNFLRASTPLAKRLARFLAATPVVTLPVIRLVQETMLKESRQVHVAEVLLGGLFEPVTPPELGINPDEVRYRFVDATLRDLLLAEASRRDMKEVLSHYISRKLGRTLSQFVAEWQFLSQQEDQGKDETEQPFAVIAAHLLKWQGRQYTEFVRQVETHYGMQILPEAVPQPDMEPTELFPGASGEALWRQVAEKFQPRQTLPPRRARELAFRIDTVQGQLSCLYTGYTIGQPQSQPLKPLEQGMNADRVWPRSRGGGDRIRGDLHITFPARVQVNSARGNAPFCELDVSEVHSWFRQDEELSTAPRDASLWGEYSKLGNRGFEPREGAKGIVARALFYVYAIYRDQIQQDYYEQQLATLLRWHLQSPATEQERRRSRRVAASEQGNENPFVLDPTLAERIYGAMGPDITEPAVEWKMDTVVAATVSELETLEFRVATVTVEAEEEEETDRLPLESFTFDIGWVGPEASPQPEVRREPGQGQQLREDLGQGVWLEMVMISGGEFWMGSPEDDPEASASERPQHLVTVPPFLMAKYPITQAQYEAVIGQNPARFQSDGADRPVERVSWHDAVAFCERLSAITNRVYRLPSEAEWEYACRGGTPTPFHFGQRLTPEVANYGGHRSETSAVGYFGVANALGLYDMHGNVWEWCADSWHGNYRGAPGDGSAWLTGRNKSRRVLRGGSWLYEPGSCRSANRDKDYPDNTHSNYGFRVACSVP